jgi:hypothetical protein
LAKKSSPPKKRRTREHVIADLSVNFLERQALLCGYSVEKITHDYGIDLFVHTYNDGGEVEPGRLLFQLKATDQPKRVQGGKAIAFQVARADLRWWLKELMPVILVLYDAQADAAYWLHIQRHFSEKGTLKKMAQGHLTLHLPMSDRLEPAAVKQLARLKQEIVHKLGRLSHHE